MAWYYLDSKQERIEVEQEALKRLLDAGVINRDTLVWNETLTDWTPLWKALPEAVAEPAPTQALNPYATPASSTLTTKGSSTIRDFAALIGANAGWIKFLGVVNIIWGALSIPLGAVMIWAGVVLFQVASAFQEAEAKGDEAAFQEALTKTSLYFKIMGIMALIGIILFAIAIVFWVVLVIAMLSSGTLQQ